MEWMALIISALAAISTGINVWTARARNNRKERVNEAVADATLEQKVDYIIERVDEIQLDFETHGHDIKQLSERMTRSEKDIQFHDRRISELEKYKILAGG